MNGVFREGLCSVGILQCGYCVLSETVCGWIRPYQHDSTASRPLSEVKHVRAWLVLRWGTTLEFQVLYSFCPLLLYSFFYSSSFSPRHHQQHAMISTWTTPQPRLHHLCFHLSTILHYIRYHDNLPFSNRQITTKKNYIQSSSPSPSPPSSLLLFLQYYGLFSNHFSSCERLQIQPKEACNIQMQNLLSP